MIELLPMLLLIALGLVLVYAILRPLADGLFNTSAWVAKILAPPDTGDWESAKLLLTMKQAALMEGWLSNLLSTASPRACGETVNGIRPNQAMELTTARTALTFYHD